MELLVHTIVRVLGEHYSRGHKMKQQEIQYIKDFLQETTEALVEWDLRGESSLVELNTLHQIIERLMQATFESKDPDEKPVLAYLEKEARECRDCILRRTGARN